MSEQIADLIDGLEFFQGFSYAETKVVSGYLAYVEVAKGETVFNEGDAGNNMLILIDGRISIFKAGESGAHLLSYEGKGRIIGEMALLDRERRSASCIADTPCQLLTLNHDGLERMAREHPAVAYHFMHQLARLLSRRLRRTSGILAEHLVDGRM
jgi:CRP-like cAMP-binding protein